MKKKKIVRRMLCALFACIFLLSLLHLTAFAADAPGSEDNPAAVDNPDTGNDTEPSDETVPSEDPTEAPDDSEEPTEAPADDPDAGNVTPTDPEDDDDLTSPPADVTPGYVEPTYLNELPTVKNEDVVTATAIPVPKAEVSNASLFSGIIMWICVAVGIAVVVGVMVSKRTRRRGS